MPPDEARRLAWGLVMRHLQMQESGDIPDGDIAALAVAMKTPSDWGQLIGTLAGISGSLWAESFEGDLPAAMAAARRMALSLAAAGE